MMASCFSIFHALLSGANLIMCNTATMIIDASVAIGRNAKNGVRYSSVNHTMRPVITHVSHVVAHAFRLTAVFEKLHATQYPQNTLELKFANHCQISSLLGDSGFLVVYETNFATDIDWVKLISHIITPNNASLKIS